jgi:GT2 family glycosyltransferase
MTLKCIDRLLSSSHPPSTVVIVDNGSDGTADSIESTGVPLWVLRNPENLGFAAAINGGSRLVREPFILWLNSDVLLERDDISRLLREAERHPEVAAVAPRQVSEDGHELPAVHRFPSSLRPFRRRQAPTVTGALRPDEFLSGACLLVRRSAWAHTGELDESFFFYWEEADWQFRARRHGWKLMLADVRVTHVGSGSASAQATALRLLSFEGYERFILKHEGRAALILHRATNLPGVLWSARAPASVRRNDRPEGAGREVSTARARLAQILRPVPAGGSSPWAARMKERG